MMEGGACTELRTISSAVAELARARAPPTVAKAGMTSARTIQASCGRVGAWLDQISDGRWGGVAKALEYGSLREIILSTCSRAAATTRHASSSGWRRAAESRRCVSSRLSGTGVTSVEMLSLPSNAEGARTLDQSAQARGMPFRAGQTPEGRV